VFERRPRFETESIAPPVDHNGHASEYSRVEVGAVLAIKDGERFSFAVAGGRALGMELTDDEVLELILGLMSVRGARRG
jgi:hypothetical protein